MITILATKIKMKPSCSNSWSLTEIDSIYLQGAIKPAFYSKEAVHDHLVKFPNTIQVDIYPYPNLIPALSTNGEKYVRSQRNETVRDSLLSLPRN